MVIFHSSLKMKTSLIIVCLSVFIGSVLAFPRSQFNNHHHSSVNGGTKNLNGNAVKAYAPINYCTVWDGSKISIHNSPICDDPFINDTSLFQSCWTVHWKGHKNIQRGLEEKCSCAGGQGEVSLNCGGDKQWYLSDQSQLHLCGQYNQRCQSNTCPELKNHKNFKCNIETTGKIGDIRNGVCKNTCRSVNLKCEKNEYNIANWVADVDCNEFEYEVPKKHLKIFVKDGGISFECLTGFELKGQNFATCYNGNIENADNPVCLPITYTTENIKSFWNNDKKTEGPVLEQEHSNGFNNNNNNIGSNNNNNNRPGNSPNIQPFFTTSKPSRNPSIDDNNYNSASLNKEKPISKLTQGILIGIIVFLIIIIAILSVFIFMKIRSDKKSKEELEVNNIGNDNKKTSGVKNDKEFMKSNDLYVSSDAVKPSVKQ